MTVVDPSRPFAEREPLFDDLTYRVLVDDELWDQYKKDHCVCPLKGMMVSAMKREMPRLDGIGRREFEQRLFPWMTGECKYHGHTSGGS